MEKTIDVPLTSNEIEQICTALLRCDSFYQEVYSKVRDAGERMNRLPSFELEDFREFRMIGGIPTKSCLHRFISRKIEFSDTYGHTKHGPDTITVYADRQYCLLLVDRLKAQGAKVNFISSHLSVTTITFIPTH